MAPTILILAGDRANDERTMRSGMPTPLFAASFLADTVDIARSVRHSRVVVRPTPMFPRSALADLPPDVAVEPIAGTGGAELCAAFADSLDAGEPVLLISSELPHLPPWRLLDALTYLSDGADAVIGPCDTGDWYLLGMRTPKPELLRLIPAAGEAPEALRRLGMSGTLPVAILPRWFIARDVRGLAGLAAVLRTMPPHVAARTRTLLENGAGTARAVGG